MFNPGTSPPPVRMATLLVIFILLEELSRSKKYHDLNSIVVCKASRQESYLEPTGEFGGLLVAYDPTRNSLLTHQSNSILSIYVRFLVQSRQAKPALDLEGAFFFTLIDQLEFDTIVHFN
jgi:hypothetical protein